MNTKYAVLFPGQGSQFIGMGKELAQNFDIAKQTFEEVDDTLNQKLSSLMFDGDIETLTQTQNAQPAIMAVSIATWRVLITESNIKEKVACVAGHSLGEYSAACAAGVFSLTDTAKLLRTRGDLEAVCHTLDCGSAERRMPRGKIRIGKLPPHRPLHPFFYNIYRI